MALQRAAAEQAAIAREKAELEERMKQELAKAKKAIQQKEAELLQETSFTTQAVGERDAQIKALQEKLKKLETVSEGDMVKASMARRQLTDGYGVEELQDVYEPTGSYSDADLLGDDLDVDAIIASAMKGSWKG